MASNSPSKGSRISSTSMIVMAEREWKIRISVQNASVFRSKRHPLPRASWKLGDGTPSRKIIPGCPATRKDVNGVYEGVCCGSF